MTNTANFEPLPDVLVERPYSKLPPKLKHAIDSYRSASYSFRHREAELKKLMHNEGLDVATDIPYFNGSLVYCHADGTLKSVRAPKPNGSKIPA